MTLSVFDIKVGIGPSSSHTVGPMRAARMFVARLAADGLLPRVARIRAELFGSLGATIGTRPPSMRMSARYAGVIANLTGNRQCPCRCGGTCNILV